MLGLPRGHQAGAVGRQGTVKVGQVAAATLGVQGPG
jgi:hypothetical protein